jgi:type II secretory pathway component GspD/PulD (secretin)
VCEATPFVLAGVSGTLGQGPEWRSSAHAALSRGIDSYRHGDYETAASLLTQAQFGRKDLSAAEQQELIKYIQLNNQALEAQRAGSEQVRRAEQATRDGRTQEAEALLRQASTNQFLTDADRQKGQQLGLRLRPSEVMVKPPADAPAGSGASPAVLARTKLHQARAMMAKGNYGAAEALAGEAKQLAVFYQVGEDTPDKVLDDIYRSRSDPHGLVAAARAAYRRGDLDLADQLARQAQRVSTNWTFVLRGDDPVKVLKDVNTERARQASLGIQSTGTASQAHAKNPNYSNYTIVAQAQPQRTMPLAVDQSEGAKLQPAVVQAGHASIVPAAGVQIGTGASVTVVAKEPAPAPTPAQAVNPESPACAASCDAPDTRQLLDQAHKVLHDASDIQVVVAPGQAAPNQTPDPRQVVKLGRALYNANKFDEAEQMARSAAKSRSTHWGFFEDTPGKLLRDIRTARARHGQQDSAQVLAQARRLFEQGEYDEAKDKAHRAEQLHGPYYVWEFGDQPQKLLAEIEAAEFRKGKAAEAAGQADALAKKDAEPQPPAPEATPAKRQPAEGARPQVDPHPAMPLADKTAVEPTPVATAPATCDKAAGHPVDPVKQAAGSPGLSTVALSPLASVDPTKQQAQQLLAEARQLEPQGRLVEAHKKAVEAQQAHAIFGPDEDSPERVLAQLAALASKRIDGLVQGATDLAATGYVDAGRYRKAEEQLGQARQLATGFGLDCQPIDAKLAWVQQTRDSAPPAQVQLPGQPVLPSVSEQTPLAEVPHRETHPAGTAAEQAGRALLDRSRTEIRAGQNEQARRDAEQAFKGHYGVQSEAEAMLRTICAEELKQRTLEAERAFDGAMTMYHRKEYAEASNILRAIDVHLLSDTRQARFREVVQAPEMQPHNAIVQTSVETPVPFDGGSEGKATASDTPGRTRVVTPEENYAQQVQAMLEIRFQKLRSDGLAAQRNALDRVRAGDINQALDILDDYLASLRDAGLEPQRAALLQRPIDVRLQMIKKLKVDQEFVQRSNSSRDNYEKQHHLQLRAEELKHKEVADLMKQYHSLYNEGKYREAEVAAMKAKELDPDDSQATAAIQVARMHGNEQEYRTLQEAKDKIVLHGLNDTDDEGPPVTVHNPLAFDPKRWEVSGKRKGLADAIELNPARSEKERYIERQLLLPTSIGFKDVPLRDVISDLSVRHNINIVPDKTALDDAGISLDQPMTMQLEGTALKSALTLLLNQAHLTYVIQNEVLLITTEANAAGKMVRRVFQVADIIIPVENHGFVSPLDTVYGQGASPAKTVAANGLSAALNRTALGSGTSVSSSGSTGDTAGQWAINSTSPLAGSRNPGQTMQDLLIDLITNTIKPETWSKVGGKATIDYFPLGMALVVNQTPDIQEQIADLLQALRRLQDLEVAVEVRFITLAEAFYERIGLDFKINVTNHNSKIEPQLTSGTFADPNQINSFSPQQFFSGLTPAGSFTSDLGIPIAPGSFGPAVPPFGGFQNAPPDGGLSFGLAFLSDIQVFMLLEAAQGDRRTNVMQAPKLTMFNGQTATITVMDEQFFVTQVQVIRDGGQLVFVPFDTPMQTGGVSLSVQTVVSADRRFVRMSLAPILTNLSQPVTALFPVTTFITPVFEGGAQGQPIPFTQYLQQPGFTTVTVNTTVSVPDGGTVLLGGLKTLREGRNEFGPPLLSKLPYINRLFKNVGYGREAESLMLMVTPRIIINEEEEELQLENRPGLLTPAAGQGGPGAAQPGGTR